MWGGDGESGRVSLGINMDTTKFMRSRFVSSYFVEIGSLNSEKLETVI